MASAGALTALYGALRGEQEKRARQRGRPFDQGDARESFYRQLDEMHERRKQAPGYREPTPAERAAHMADLDAWAGLPQALRRLSAASPRFAAPLTNVTRQAVKIPAATRQPARRQQASVEA